MLNPEDIYTTHAYLPIISGVVYLESNLGLDRSHPLLLATFRAPEISVFFCPRGRRRNVGEGERKTSGGHRHGQGAQMGCCCCGGGGGGAGGGGGGGGGFYSDLGRIITVHGLYEEEGERVRIIQDDEGHESRG